MTFKIICLALPLCLALACTPKKVAQKTADPNLKVADLTEVKKETPKPGRGEPTRYKIVSLERTGCYGKCPTYLFEVWNDGVAFYAGARSVERLGKFEARASEEQMSAIRELGAELGILKMEDGYPLIKEKRPADLPVTNVYFNNGDKEHFTTDVIGAPVELTKFELLIDQIMNNMDWKPIKN